MTKSPMESGFSGLRTEYETLYCGLFRTSIQPVDCKSGCCRRMLLMDPDRVLVLFLTIGSC